jgi:hypothetical protein
VKYLLVYYGGGMPATLRAQARALKQWERWFEKVGSSMVDGGNPMSGAVNKIRADGSVAKGPIGKRASGYSILEAPSLDQATKLAKGCPILRGGGEIAVYETFNAM